MILEWVIKSVVVILFGLTGFAYTTYYERRWLARIQTRIGPNRAGPWGLLQPVADGIKLIFKEELVPEKAYKVAFMLAPVITMAPALIVMGVLPWGETVSVTIGGVTHYIELSLANLNVGVLYILSVTSISVYGVVLAGWSSNNKYAMLGGLRSTAQMISYELALGLAFLGPVIMSESMNMIDIVRFQEGRFWTLWAPAQFLGAIIFLIAMTAEINRAPFDMPEAEQELVAGYHTEYSGMKFALFFMGEYVKMVAVSAIFITLFWGGFSGPGVGQTVSVFGWFSFNGNWLGPLYYFLKVFIMLGILIWIRGTLPRFRYDRLMAFGWKILLPIALFNVFLVAVISYLNFGGA